MKRVYGLGFPVHSYYIFFLLRFLDIGFSIILNLSKQ